MAFWMIARILDNESFLMVFRSTFLTFNKVVQVVQIGGRGWRKRHVIWTKSKRIAVFSQETFPYSERELWKSSLILQVGVCFCRKHNVSCFYLVTCVGGISWRVLRNFWNQDHSERVTSFEQWAERGRTLPHQARIELSDFHARVWKYDQGGRNSMQEMHGNPTKSWNSDQ